MSDVYIVPTDRIISVERYQNKTKIVTERFTAVINYRIPDEEYEKLLAMKNNVKVEFRNEMVE